jgi:hypothetical protein
VSTSTLYSQRSQTGALDEQEIWSGDIEIEFAGLVTFAGTGSVWAALRPTPTCRFRVSFEGSVDGDPLLHTGLATMRIGGSSYEHGVFVSKPESHALFGHLTGPPPPPAGDAMSIAFGVLNLDPKSLWPDEVVVDGWRFRLGEAVEPAVDREYLRDVLGVAETHSGVLDRADGGPFEAVEGLSALDGWRLALSFATGFRIGVWRQVLGRQSGEIDDGWRALASPAVEPWQDHHRVVDAYDKFGIAELVGLMLARRVQDPVQAAVDDLAINFALEANGRAPIQMRIAAVGAGLELLAWDQLVEDPGDCSLSKAERKRQYGERPAAQNFRRLLERASIGTEVPEILHRFASVDGGTASGPGAVAKLRNSVMHPRRREGELLAPAELWAEGWQLGMQYLELLILHRLGFRGRYSDRFRSGWVGETFGVPWAPHGSPSNPTG